MVAKWDTEMPINYSMWKNTELLMVSVGVSFDLSVGLSRFLSLLF